MARQKVGLASVSALGWSAFQLAVETQTVIALRMFRIATARSPGGELTRMMSEKVEAAFNAQRAATGAVAAGRPKLAASRVLGVYRRKVRANRKRLTK